MTHKHEDLKLTAVRYYKTYFHLIFIKFFNKNSFFHFSYNF